MEPVAPLAPWLEPRLSRLDAFLTSALADAWPPRFAEAVAYPVFGGGKRVRPALVFAAFEAVAGAVDPEPAIAAAAAVELVHTYSLVHDDLPCMDDDDTRRGRPTVHKRYGDGPAVLVGDALLTEAFAALARSPVAAELRIEMVRALADAAGHRGMVGGQAADVGLGGPVVELDALRRLHAGKTGALITAAAVLGGLTAGAAPEALGALERYGRAIGLAFQLADDVLDADQDSGDDGPPSFVRLLGVDATRAEAVALMEQASSEVRSLRRPDVLLAIARFVVDRDH
ncbi:MAG: polyprenyl synthetase family protein [Myxococcota bacterium]